MKIKLYRPLYLVRYYRGNRQTDLPVTKTWDGQSLLLLGSPARFILQVKQNRILVRNLAATENLKNPLKTLNFSCLNQRLTLSDETRESIELIPFQALARVEADSFHQIGNYEIAPKIPTLEDQKYNRDFKRLSVSALVLFLAIFATRFGTPTTTTTEELIPAKYAKLILTKPKEKPSAPTSGGQTPSQAQVKGIARAFQSKTVQKSIQSILRGGLSRYSILTTGRAIQNLSRSIATNANVNGVGDRLDQKASDLLAGSRVGPNQLGGSGGFGSGHGLNVKGQGNGQFEVGLNTQDASVDEGLTKDEVARVIHSHLSEIRYCYEAAILKDPTLAGKVLIDFKINPTGMVPNAGVSEASLTDVHVSNCLLGKLKTWKFPQPRGGVQVAVSYPFVFKSLSR